MIATDANMPVRCVTDDAASQTGVAAHLLASHWVYSSAKRLC